MAIDALSNNPVVATLVEILTNYAVGTGLTLSSRPDFEALSISREAARELSDQIETEVVAMVSVAE